jgi:hydroxyacyl-ACP dehydratase HTD2-like protein with hotdog domain
MLDRPAVSFHECVNFDTDRKLTDTLGTFLPPRWCGRLQRGRSRVPLGHSLLWFNTAMPVDKLLPDGTDPLQSPGEPWMRRMWAGGNMQMRQDEYFHKQRGFAIDSEMVCAERIKDVQLRGKGDAAKIFVTLERRYTRWDTLHKYMAPGRRAAQSSDVDTEAIFQQQLLNEDWADAVLKEERDLVFLKEKTPSEIEAIKAGQLASIKYLEGSLFPCPVAMSR